MKACFHKAPDCPEHPEEQLQMEALHIKFPTHPDGIESNFYYCPKTNKYLNHGKLVSKEEIALNYINEGYKKEYKISDIEVITLREFTKRRRENPNTNL